MIKMKHGVIAMAVSYTIRIFVKVLFAVSSVRSMWSASSVAAPTINSNDNKFNFCCAHDSCGAAAAGAMLNWNVPHVRLKLSLAECDYDYGLAASRMCHVFLLLSFLVLASLLLSSVGPTLCALLNTILVAVLKAKLLLFPLQKFSFRKFCAFVLENWQRQHQHVWSVYGLPLPLPVPLTNRPTTQPPTHRLSVGAINTCSWALKRVRHLRTVFSSPSHGSLAKLTSIICHSIRLWADCLVTGGW